ncbi:hypothetical protein D9M69_722830 [compost metagenome]
MAATTSFSLALTEALKAAVRAVRRSSFFIAESLWGWLITCLAASVIGTFRQGEVVSGAAMASVDEQTSGIFYSIKILLFYFYIL